jgi:murein L,D-transpeptidase YcbB/YkuD
MVVLLFFGSCKETSSPSHQVVIARSPEEFQQKSTDLIKDYLDEIEKKDGKIDDTVALSMHNVVRTIYQNNSFKTAWSENEQWHPQADSLFDLIQHAKWYGLFPEDYHFTQLNSIRTRFFNDSMIKVDRRDVALWTKADIMLTDAFAHIIKDVKLGRLPNDSVTLRSDTVLEDDFYWQQFYVLQKRGSLQTIIERHEPKQIGYKQLKDAVKKFLENADDTTRFTTVPSVKDPQFKTLLQRRLFEGGYLETDSVKADSVQLVAAIKNFQKDAGINADGRVGDVTLRMMNTSAKEKFVRIAITMDRYKLLPEKMPDRYILVNLSGYNLKLMEGDSIKLYSKIICGKPITRSPVLNSFISEMITYPQWTVPQSIIEKEILPGAKRNSSYITKKGFSLLDSKGNVVNPDSVDWSKFKRSIPYKVVQGSGDDNALGIMKFNFYNKYAVYLHDTNQRYLFANSDRSLSHGCIRVQNWESLAFDILRHEDQSSKEDSVRIWLKEKRKHSVSVRNRLPLFIRYFTCEGKDGNIVFYDDIYGEDKMLRKKYFPGK